MNKNGRESTALAGVDYGSKKAGTTVIAAGLHNHIHFWKSAAKKDADTFLVSWCRERSPDQLFLDAPLSLPGIYRDLPDCRDYFYREADRALQAMSPMFLGGLTARAMRLRDTLGRSGIAVREVYPARLAQRLGLADLAYKKQVSAIPAVLEALQPHLPFPFSAEEAKTWHHVDALLALLSGYRFSQGRAEAYGRPDEGRILV